MKEILIAILMIILTGCTPTTEPANIPEEDKTPAIIDGGEIVDPEIPEEEPEIEPEEEKEKEMFEEYYKEAEEIMANMTLEERLAQMFFVMYPGKTATDTQITKNCPAGYILFAKDVKVESKESLTKLISDFQEKAPIKMLWAVDEEGGPVVRVSAYKQFRETPFSSMRKIYEKGGMEAVINDSHDKNQFLKSFGINMNLTPVVDIPTSSQSYMYSRAIDNDEAIVSEFAGKVIEQMNQDGVIASMKHFPGYGDNVDTHTGIAVDERTIDEFWNKDFKPFIAGINANVPTIMVNHNIIKDVDETLPASISKPVHDILRNQMNYSGLIVTDALSMDAVKQYVDGGEAAVQAVIAGNDLILTGTFEAHMQEVLNALNDGRISEEQINTACRRVIACKLAYGIND